MRENQYPDDRWVFIEKTQDWFEHKNHFWLSLSLVAFSSILLLQVLFSFASLANHSARQQAEFLIIPILSLFVFSIFWRNVFCTFLSLVGTTLIYGGMFLFHTAAMKAQLSAPFIANRLGFGIKHVSVVSPDSISNIYFIVGALTLAFCIAIAIKPDLFKPKDPQELPYQIWRHGRDSKLIFGSGAIRLVPLSSLLSYAEQQMVGKYKYLTVIIGGRKFLVGTYEWIPENSIVVRDEESGSIIGI